MKYLVFISFALLSCFFALGQGKYSNEYEIKFIKSENGKVYFTVYNYCKREKKCLELAKIDAVKVVLFRGFNDENKIYPIIKDYNLQQKNKSYFDEFFKTNGQYLSYIEYSEDFDVETVEITKRKKKAGMNICILRDNLLKEMQSQKIIKMLNDGF